MKIRRWSGLAALPLLASLLATDAWAQGVCDWYGFAPRVSPVAADVVISSSTDYYAWATINGKRVARLHFQNQCRVTAQVDQDGTITAYPAAIKLTDSSGDVEYTQSTITFFAPKGKQLVQFDQVVFQALKQTTSGKGKVTSDPYGTDQTELHLPTFTFNAAGYRMGTAISAPGYGAKAQLYKLFCVADPVIPNRYGYDSEYSRETGRATRLFAGPNNPPDPMYYDGGGFPEHTLWDAARGILQRFHNVDVKLDPAQLKGKQLGAVYYKFDLVRDAPCSSE